MKHRNLIAVIIFSIITLGVYDLYWLVKTKTVLNKQTKVHTPTIFLILLPYIVVAALVGVVIVFGIHHNANTVTSNAYATNPTLNHNFIYIAIAEFIAALVILPVTFYWFFNFSKSVNEYTHGEINTALAFVLLFMLRFIGIAVIQDKFNEMLAGSSTVSPKSKTVDLPK